MKRLSTILLLLLLLFQPAAGQYSKKVKDLNNQKAKLQKELKASQQKLTQTRTDVKKGQLNIRYLDQEIEVRVKYIHQTEHELDSLQTLVDSVQGEIHYLDSVLTSKKAKYTHALRATQAYRKVNSTLLFALSASAAAAVSQPAFRPIISTTMTYGVSYTSSSRSSSEMEVAIYFAAEPKPGQ